MLESPERARYEGPRVIQSLLLIIQLLGAPADSGARECEFWVKAVEEGLSLYTKENGLPAVLRGPHFQRSLAQGKATVSGYFIDSIATVELHYAPGKHAHLRSGLLRVFSHLEPADHDSRIIQLPVGGQTGFKVTIPRTLSAMSLLAFDQIAKVYAEQARIEGSPRILFDTYFWKVSRERFFSNGVLAQSPHFGGLSVDHFYSTRELKDIFGEDVLFHLQERLQADGIKITQAHSFDWKTKRQRRFLVIESFYAQVEHSLRHLIWWE